MTGHRTVTANFTYLPPPAGLIAWWRGETDASDAIASHHGVSVGGAGITASGQVGGAFSFDGSGYVQVPDAPDLKPELFTAEAWVYPTLLTATPQTVLARGSSVDDDDTWALAVVNGKVRLASRHLGTGMAFLETPGTIPLNQWTHLAVSFDGFNRRIYVNGVEVNSDRFLGPLVYDPAAVPVTIGSDWAANASTERFTGRIDEVSLYDRLLSAAEIAAIQASGPAGKAATQPYFTTPSQLPDAVVGDPYARCRVGGDRRVAHHVFRHGRRAPAGARAHRGGCFQRDAAPAGRLRIHRRRS